jgi:adenosine kinase
VKEIKSLIAIGNPIVDISAKIDKETIAKYELAWGQTVFINETNKGIFEELEKSPDVCYVPGGGIENSLRVCAWCLKMNEEKKDKFKLTMLGCTGDDEYRKKIVNALEDIGVTPLFEINKEQSTSRCGVGINEKERCLVSHIMASNTLSISFIEQNMKTILSHEAIIIEGYFLLERFEICKQLVNEFKKANKPIIFTLCAVFLLQNIGDKMIKIANDADIIFGNMDECEALAGQKGEIYSETFGFAHKKLTPKDRKLIITCGSRGVFCSKYNYEEDRLDFVLQGFPTFIKKSEIVDMNGAGDAFLGGYISQWMRGKSVNICAKAGNEASGIILKNVGCTFDKNMTLDFQE